MTSADTDSESIITLESGRVVLIGSLHQALTYGGLQLGHPNPEMNDRILSSLERPPAYYGLGSHPVVLRSPSRNPENPRERLPRIKCLAALKSAPTNQDEAYSFLAAVWLQETYGTIAQDALGWIKTIDWDTNCANGTD